MAFLTYSALMLQAALRLPCTLVSNSMQWILANSWKKLQGIIHVFTALSFSWLFHLCLSLLLSVLLLILLPKKIVSFSTHVFERLFSKSWEMSNFPHILLLIICSHTVSESDSWVFSFPAQRECYYSHFVSICTSPHLHRFLSKGMEIIILFLFLPTTITTMMTQQVPIFPSTQTRHPSLASSCSSRVDSGTLCTCCPMWVSHQIIMSCPRASFRYSRLCRLNSWQHFLLHFLEKCFVQFCVIITKETIFSFLSILIHLSHLLSCPKHDTLQLNLETMILINT
jgi:hypothetical protein